MADAIVDEARVWALLQVLAARARAGEPLSEPAGVRFGDGEAPRFTAPGNADLTLLPDSEAQFSSVTAPTLEAAQLLRLYLPLCLGERCRNLVLAHLGQSLDGQIATASGAARYVTGPENLRHLHRLRALFDAVVVGASTVAADDPQLTTRLVDGPNPTRVVLDPRRRLSAEHGVFRDGAAETLVVCAAGLAADDGRRFVELPLDDGILAPRAVLSALAERGLRRVFIEGGGVTVSRFLVEGAVDRLQVTVAPLFVGRGRAGVALPGVDRLEEALRPPARRFDLGTDVLFDCELSSGRPR